MPRIVFEILPSAEYEIFYSIEPKVVEILERSEFRHSGHGDVMPYNISLDAQDSQLIGGISFLVTSSMEFGEEHAIAIIEAINPLIEPHKMTLNKR